MAKYTHAYIGVKDCGCVVAITVDTPQRPKEVAIDVAEFIENGLHIERLPLDDARTKIKPCIHKSEVKDNQP